MSDEDSDNEETEEEWDINDSGLGSSSGGFYGMAPSESAGSLSGWGTPEKIDSFSGQLSQLRVGKTQ